jgi:pimeloyl-ACP methyl ester carboxylesterase
VILFFIVSIVIYAKIICRLKYYALNQLSVSSRTNSKLCLFCIVTILFLVVCIFINGIGFNLNSPKPTLAQQQLQPQANLTSAEQQLMEGISSEIDNVTFSHHTASVNGIQMHYVIGGQGDPVVLLHGWPQTWYEWHKVMPALAKNYTVVAPDLRGLGDSSKPFTGYDGNTTAEDIYQLVSQLGFQKIYLVGHDIGVLTAYSYAASHHNNVSKLVILDVPPLPPPGFENCCWWFRFHQTPDIPEALTAGKEREYLSWFYRFAYNPEAITENDIDKYVASYSAPGGMRAGFEYYRAFPITLEQNKEHANVRLPMPVLALGGEYSFGTAALTSMKSLATDVRGGIVPLSGHWIPEEQPDFLVKQLAAFFSE